MVFLLQLCRPNKQKMIEAYLNGKRVDVKVTDYACQKNTVLESEK